MRESCFFCWPLLTSRYSHIYIPLPSYKCFWSLLMLLHPVLSAWAALISLQVDHLLHNTSIRAVCNPPPSPSPRHRQVSLITLIKWLFSILLAFWGAGRDDGYESRTIILKSSQWTRDVVPLLFFCWLFFFSAQTTFCGAFSCSQTLKLYICLWYLFIKAVLSAHDTVAQKNFDPVLPPLPEDLDDDLEEESVKIVRLVKNKEPLVRQNKSPFLM